MRRPAAASRCACTRTASSRSWNRASLRSWSRLSAAPMRVHPRKETRCLQPFLLTFCQRSVARLGQSSGGRNEADAGTSESAYHTEERAVHPAQVPFVPPFGFSGRRSGGALYERIICVVPMVGAGTLEDPKASGLCACGGPAALSRPQRSRRRGRGFVWPGNIGNNLGQGHG